VLWSNKAALKESPIWLDNSPSIRDCKATRIPEKADRDLIRKDLLIE
jgi:hypothetical protein